MKQIHPSTPLIKYKGKPYRKHTVAIIQEGLHRRLWRKTAIIKDVIAPSPSHAIELVRDEIEPTLDHPATFISWGVKGGETRRFTGHETLISRHMFRRPTTLHEQLALPV